MPAYELNFRDYLRILHKRYWIVVVSIIIATLAVAIKSARQVPFYRAEVTVRIEERKTLVGTILDRPIYSRGVRDYLSSEMRVIRSRTVAEEVARRLGQIKDTMSKEEVDTIAARIQGSISVETVTEGDRETDLVKIVVTTTNPRLSAQIANTVAKVYQQENLKQKSREVRKNREFVEKQLATIEKKLKASEDILTKFKEKEPTTTTSRGQNLSGRLANLELELMGLLTRATEKHPTVLRLKEQIARVEQQMKDLPEGELEYWRLMRDVEVNDKLYRMLRDRVEEARIAEAGKVSEVTIVNPAGEVGYLVGPDKRRNLIIGFMLGSVIGFVLMFVTEAFDTSIGRIEDVESYIKLSVLGVIPSARAIKEKSEEDKKGHLEQRSDICFMICERPSSSFAEAFRILRTNLKIEKGAKKTILVTSTGPREGKTTVMVGLGLVLSQLGLKTLLVDTDLRRPSVSKIFGLEREPGLNELLITGAKDINNTVRNFTDFLIGELGFDYFSQLPGLETLNIITSGSLTSNSSEILGSGAMKRLMGELKERFDVIIFDSPPALSVTDASILARHVDGIIIVYEMGRTSRDALLRTKIQLESVGAKILGVVLNHTRPQTEFQTSYYPYYYSYKYKYYYSDKEGEGKRKG